jgi:hypothetical protein
VGSIPVTPLAALPIGASSTFLTSKFLKSEPKSSRRPADASLPPNTKAANGNDDFIKKFLLELLLSIDICNIDEVLD